MKLLRFAIALCALVWFSCPAQAAVLVFSGDKVAGADGVVVGGTSYDVRFRDGSCLDLFRTCGLPGAPYDFTFSSFDSAKAASEALLIQVVDALPELDATPSMMTGCAAPPAADDCHIHTPFNIAADRVFTSVLNTQPGAVDWLLDDYALIFWTDAMFPRTASSPTDFVFAVWSASAVPEPASFGLAAMAISALVVVRRRRSA